MAKQRAKTAVPRLRFPEFSKASEWGNELMSSLYFFIRNNSLSRDKLNYESGDAKNIHYGDIHTKFPALFDITKELVPYVNSSEEIPAAGSEDYCIEGDMIFADASEDTKAVGKSMEIVRLAGEQLLSGQHTILARQKNDAIVVGFGGYLFQSGLIRSRIEREAQGTKVYQISSSRLGGIDIGFPRDKAEQQKIADCLTSLDEVIAAETRKLDALKAHKKALMQQLFPNPDDVATNLNAGGGVMLSLRTVADFIKTKIPTSQLAPDQFVSTENILPEFGGIAKSHRLPLLAKAIEFQSGDVLASNIRPYLKKIWKSTMHGGASNDVLVMRAKMGMNPDYLAVVLKSDRFIDHMMKGAKGVKMPRGELSAIKEFLVYCPNVEEQLRISDCISSVDELIAGQLKKIKNQTRHKMGLMQQLFPAPDGVTT